MEEKGKRENRKAKRTSILFVFHHPKEEWWMDGLWAALNEIDNDLEGGFEVSKLNLYKNETSKIDIKKYDFVLGWGAFGSPADIFIQNRKAELEGKIKTGLCIGGVSARPSGALSYNVLFYETKWYRPQIDFHPNIVHAFGINDLIFNKEPIVNLGGMAFALPIVWDYLGVGAFAKWKRWDRMKKKSGIRMVVGEYQEGNEEESLEIIRDLIRSGIMVSPMVHPIDLANFYKWSGCVYIPADIYGGGERVVMEAKACGCRVEIEDDNPKLKEILEGPVVTHKEYARKLKEGIWKTLS